MIELLQGGMYLVNGTEIVPEDGEAKAAILAKTGKGGGKEYHRVRYSGKSQYLRKYG